MKTSDPNHIANMLFKEMVRLHGLPKSIVSNTDTKFVGHYGKRWELTLILIKPIILKKNRQTEVTNRGWDTF